jgi:hypothetical protein
MNSRLSLGIISSCSPVVTSQRTVSPSLLLLIGLGGEEVIYTEGAGNAGDGTSLELVVDYLCAMLLLLGYKWE